MAPSILITDYCLSFWFIEKWGKNGYKKYLLFHILGGINWLKLQLPLSHNKQWKIGTFLKNTVILFRSLFCYWPIRYIFRKMKQICFSINQKIQAWQYLFEISYLKPIKTNLVRLFVCFCCLVETIWLQNRIFFQFEFPSIKTLQSCLFGHFFLKYSVKTVSTCFESCTISHRRICLWSMLLVHPVGACNYRVMHKSFMHCHHIFWVCFDFEKTQKQILLLHMSGTKWQLKVEFPTNPACKECSHSSSSAGALWM